MLSVLIPVKDWNPLPLVVSLTDQLVALGQPFEILVSDDGDPDGSASWNKKILEINDVQYFSQPVALGRSANRNFFAGQAQYRWLWFMDGDAGMTDLRVAARYLEFVSPDTVLCGGTLYDPEPPIDVRFRLRWKFGRLREQIDASRRQENPWRAFSTFNFIIPAAIFQSIRFDESITGYGHEDTLFGIQLQQAGVRIIHLNNGLLHLGLEPAAVFLRKTRESAANLRRLYEQGLIPQEAISGIRLLANWIRLRRYGLSPAIRLMFTLSQRRLEKMLSGPDPSIFLLDLYKLGAINQIG